MCSNYNTEKTECLEVDHNWQQSCYLPLYRRVESVMTYCQNLKQKNHLNSPFFFRIYVTFVWKKSVTRPMSTQECSWTIQTERSWKMMNNGLTQHIPSTEKKKSDKKVCCVLQQGQKEWKCLAVLTVWGCPSYRRMFLGLRHSTIILGHQYWCFQ
jgi:hypothetical protein